MNQGTSWNGIEARRGLRRRLMLGVIVPACAMAFVFCGGPTKEPAPAVENPPAPAPAAQPAKEASGETTAVSPDFQPARATGAVQGVPAPTNTAPIIAMANYFADLPGMDLTGLKPRQRE